MKVSIKTYVKDKVQRPKVIRKKHKIQEPGPPSSARTADLHSVGLEWLLMRIQCANTPDQIFACYIYTPKYLRVTETLKWLHLTSALHKSDKFLHRETGIGWNPAGRNVTGAPPRFANHVVLSRCNYPLTRLEPGSKWVRFLRHLSEFWDSGGRLTDTTLTGFPRKKSLNPQQRQRRTTGHHNVPSAGQALSRDYIPVGRFQSRAFLPCTTAQTPNNAAPREPAGTPPVNWHRQQTKLNLGHGAGPHEFHCRGSKTCCQHI